MNRLNSLLPRLLIRCSPEHLTAFGMFFFGCHTLASWLLSDNHRAASAFATILPTGPGYDFATVGGVALPLIVGGFLQSVGLARNYPRALIAGGCLGFFVFFTAFISCCIGNPLGTGFPAYAIIDSLFLFVSLCRPLGIRWVPIAE